MVEAKQLQAKYGDKLCFMVVSFADSKHGEETLKQIAALSRCGCFVKGEDFLRDQAARVAFLRCGLYEEISDMAETVVFRSIYFDFDKYNIKPEFFPVLDEGVAMSKSKGNMGVVLEGHTDSVGTDSYNQALSNRRANSVKAYFVKKGVDASRITTVGYGESRPRADNATAEGRKLNRRVGDQVQAHAVNLQPARRRPVALSGFCGIWQARSKTKKGSRRFVWNPLFSWLPGGDSNTQPSD